MELQSAELAEDATIATVRRCFEHVFDRSPIGPLEDFFDLGGDSMLAIQLFVQIHQVTGRELPISLIYEAPTIAAIADVVRRQHAPLAPSLLVGLKPGSGQTPLFIVHGIYGNVMELLELGKRIQSEQPVYALQARGLDGHSTPDTSVEAMAEAYLEAIRTAQPRGPYLLAGFSFGGLVALEMAVRLREAGETVKLLALIDSYPHPRGWPRWVKLAVHARLMGHYAAVALRTPPGSTIARVRRVMQRGAWPFREVMAADLRKHELFAATEPTTFDTLLLRSLETVQCAGQSAWLHYRPRHYDGTATFIGASSNPQYPTNPGSIWRPLTRELVVRLVPGDHRSMVRGNVSSLAGVLSAAVASALAPDPVPDPVPDPASGPARPPPRVAKLQGYAPSIMRR